MQIVLSNNRVLAYGKDCFLAMGGTVICEATGKAYQNATVAETDSPLPSDIDTVGYEYHAGVFVPCAPYGKGAGAVMVACEDCGTPKSSGVRADAEGNITVPGNITADGKILNELYKHCWRRRSSSVEATLGTLTWYAITKNTSGSTTTTISYSDNYVIDSEGVVSLAEPISTVAISYNNFGGSSYTTPPTLIGKYFKAVTYGTTFTISGTSSTTSGAIYYIPDDADTDVYSTSSKYATEVQAQRVTSEVVYSEWEYLYSNSRDAYPDSGTVDGLIYAYLGVPFENARDVSKIECGSYTGTGTSGSDAPCRLTFARKPVAVMITCYGNTGATAFFMRGSNRGAVLAPVNATSAASANGWYLSCSWGETYLEWYSTEGYEAQFNYLDHYGSNREYDYIAFFE